MTDVVAALIWDNDRFLACQRPAHKARGLLWEFVGGKVEPGETPEEALIRECREELDVTVRVGNVFMTLIHEYPDLTVRLILFNAAIVSGKPKKLEHNDIRWITTGEIDNYDFCPADEEILKKLKTIHNGLQASLLSLADPKYKAFQCSLMPTVPEDTVIGVRMPQLRKTAAVLTSYPDADTFLASLPHKFYEENNIHGILISKMSSYEMTIAALDAFLPYVDNWATCDLVSPKSFRNQPNGLQHKVQQWLQSDHLYTVRFGIGVLMKYYLDGAFSPKQLEWVCNISSNEYYIKTMQAWYFATALYKQYGQTISLLTDHKLSPWVHNKTIQKAVESLRIPTEIKAYLKTLKR
jgi:mutator protein MutT